MVDLANLAIVCNLMLLTPSTTLIKLYKLIKFMIKKRYSCIPSGFHPLASSDILTKRYEKKRNPTIPSASLLVLSTCRAFLFFSEIKRIMASITSALRTQTPPQTSPAVSPAITSTISREVSPVVSPAVSPAEEETLFGPFMLFSDFFVF